MSPIGKAQKPDGEYTSKSTGKKMIVRDGQVYDAAPSAPEAPDMGKGGAEGGAEGQEAMPPAPSSDQQKEAGVMSFANAATANQMPKMAAAYQASTGPEGGTWLEKYKAAKQAADPEFAKARGMAPGSGVAGSVAAAMLPGRAGSAVGRIAGQAALGGLSSEGAGGSTGDIIANGLMSGGLQGVGEIAAKVAPWVIGKFTKPQPLVNGPIPEGAAGAYEPKPFNPASEGGFDGVPAVQQGATANIRPPTPPQSPMQARMAGVQGLPPTQSSIPASEGGLVGMGAGEKGLIPFPNAPPVPGAIPKFGGVQGPGSPVGSPVPGQTPSPSPTLPEFSSVTPSIGGAGGYADEGIGQTFATPSPPTQSNMTAQQYPGAKGPVPDSAPQPKPTMQEFQMPAQRQPGGAQGRPTQQFEPFQERATQQIPAPVPPKPQAPTQQFDPTGELGLHPTQEMHASKGPKRQEMALPESVQSSKQKMAKDLEDFVMKKMGGAAPWYVKQGVKAAKYAADMPSKALPPAQAQAIKQGILKATSTAEGAANLESSLNEDPDWRAYKADKSGSNR